MSRAKTHEPLARDSASDLWRHTLSQIPSIFGRLVYLSSLRNPNTDTYEHHGFRQMFGSEESDRALRESHAGAFGEWLGYSLEQQKADLDLYISGLENNKKVIIEAWLKLTPYRHLIPGSARRAERQVYLADLKALLSLLSREYGDSLAESDA